MPLAKTAKYGPSDFWSRDSDRSSPKLDDRRRSVTLVTDIEFWERSHGSHTRIRGLLRHLSTYHTVKVFFLGHLSARMRDAFNQLELPSAQICSYEEFSGVTQTVTKDLQNISFFENSREEFVLSLYNYLQKYPTEFLVVEYIRLAYLLDACPPNVQSILDTHDVMSERMMSLVSAGLKPSIMLSLAMEKRIYQSFDRILTISRADQSHVETIMGLNNAIYVPSSVDEQSQGPRPMPQKWWSLFGPLHAVSKRDFGAASKRDPSSRQLLFLGAGSKVNVAGLRWFLEQVWPILWPQGFQLDVVGRVSEAFPDSVEGVVFHGRQDDVRPFFEKANISINPVFVGGGLKIKCIDALAAGIPCVTTPEGAAGLDMARYAGLYVCRSRSEFSKQIMSLSDNHAERQRVEVLAPLFVRNEFSQDRAFLRLQAWMQALPTNSPV